MVRGFEKKELGRRVLGHCGPRWVNAVPKTAVKLRNLAFSVSPGKAESRKKRSLDTYDQ